MAPPNVWTYDPSKMMRVAKSNSKSFKLLAIGLVFVAISTWMILGGAVDRQGESTIIFGWVGGIFSGALALVHLQRILLGDDLPLVLSPSGLIDKRFSNSEVPWLSLTGISKWASRGASFVILDMKPEDFEKIQLSRVAKTVRWPNKVLLGGDRIWISTADLDISFEDVEKAIDAYAKTHNPALQADS